MLLRVLILALCVNCASTGKQKKKKPNPEASLARGGSLFNDKCKVGR